MNPLLIVIVFVAAPLIVWGLADGFRHGRFKRAVYAREDAAPDWQSRFPDAMPVVDRVLTMFCEAFLLNDRYKYRLHPDDRVMEFYRRTTGPICDEMQYERLSMMIDEAFGVDLAEHLNDETALVHLVDAAIGKSSSAKARHGI